MFPEYKKIKVLGFIDWYIRDGWTTDVEPLPERNILENCYDEDDTNSHLREHILNNDIKDELWMTEYYACPDCKQRPKVAIDTNTGKMTPYCKRCSLYFDMPENCAGAFARTHTLA